MVIESFEPTAVYRKTKDGRFFAFCPEVAGVASEGRTLEEARAMIREALAGVIEVVLERDFPDYFKSAGKKILRRDIVENIDIDKKLQVAVSIRMARERSGLTQAQVAEKLGVKQQHISRYEKGIVVPSADRFLKLFEVLKPALTH
jgi:predicted RNase H-like HicB family nuclease/DNA-binding XRE family transcriptional regulator